jgi:hypothetical protein
MQLSKHLSLAEVIRSSSAKRLGISNMPTAEHIENFKLLAENVFEPVREWVGSAVYISSGYRSKELNSFIGGSSSSQHCKGEAIDMDMDGSSSGVTNADIFNYIKDNLVFDQLIWEFGDDENPDWVHVSFSKNKNRKQILKATKVNGVTKYTKY